LLALLVTVSVLSTGLAGVALADDTSTTANESATASETTPDGDAVVENVTERIETLETVEFTRTSVSEFDGRTSNTTTRVVADVDANKMRTDTVQSSYGSNTSTVVNGTHITTYNPDENTVNTVEYESQTGSVLPQLTQLANESAVEYGFAGTATIDGEDVYLLDATPQQTYDEQNVSMTVAVDTETYFPVQIETEIRSDRYNVTATQTYTNVSINREIPESAFELDVPADATEPSFDGPEISSYDEYGRLQSSAELSLPAAELAGDYEFDSGQIIDGEGYYSVSLTYTDGDDRVQVTTQEESPFDWSERDGVEEVSLGEETGYYAESGEYAFLHADTDGQSYHVYGKLDREQIVDVGTAVVGS